MGEPACQVRKEKPCLTMKPGRGSGCCHSSGAGRQDLRAESRPAASAGCPQRIRSARSTRCTRSSRRCCSRCAGSRPAAAPERGAMPAIELQSERRCCHSSGRIFAQDPERSARQDARSESQQSGVIIHEPADISVLCGYCLRGYHVSKTHESSSRAAAGL